MSKGSAAKAYVEAVLKESFKDNYLGFDGKKYYVLAPENGEMLQIAITLSCPKTLFTSEERKEDEVTSYDWSNTSAPVKDSTIITSEEYKTLKELLDQLGLNKTP